MIKFFTLLIILQVSAFASSREKAQKILDQFSGLNEISERMEKLSQVFLGLPYGDGGPLGEGPDGRYDQDPLYRFDTFDCTTYVETIVSLSLANTVDDFETLMDKIRYENSEVDYLKRNHFPGLQWIPFNIENGLLSEINHLIAPEPEIKLASAIINLPGWLRAIKIEEIKVPMSTTEEKQRLLQELHALSVEFAPVRANLEYVPISWMLAHPESLQNIPHGSIANFVRPNWDLTSTAGTHMNVSHQGLLFKKNGIVYLRHASTAAPKQVAELPFLDYLKKWENHPTMKGVHFMKVN